jgi:hypothetical protein
MSLGVLVISIMLDLLRIRYMKASHPPLYVTRIQTSIWGMHVPTAGVTYVPVRFLTSSIGCEFNMRTLYQPLYPTRAAQTSMTKGITA